MKTYFYLPAHYLPSAERRQIWEKTGQAPELIGSGKEACAQCWLYQTAIHMRGLANIELVTTLPGDGVIVTLSNLLGSSFHANDRQFVVSIVADYLPHVGAQLQILQNRKHARRLANSIFMPLWTQPNLIPRDKNRGAKFERIAFFGDLKNLDPQLASPKWRTKLKAELGLELLIRSSKEWHDYSDIDATIGIRDFSRAAHLHKPPTKLHNAWLAGVPFIAGSDSAYEAERESEYDFLTARTAEELWEILQRLKADEFLRFKIIDAGNHRAKAFIIDAIREYWRIFLNDELPTRVRSWNRRSKLSKKWFWLKQRALFVLDRKIRS